MWPNCSIPARTGSDRALHRTRLAQRYRFTWNSNPSGSLNTIDRPNGSSWIPRIGSTPAVSSRASTDSNGSELAKDTPAPPVFPTSCAAWNANVYPPMSSSDHHWLVERTVAPGINCWYQATDRPMLVVYMNGVGFKSSL